MSVEGGPQFIDTNVLVYAFDRTAAAKHERARTLLGELWRSRNGRLSIQVLQEFYVTVTLKIEQPLQAATAAEIVADLGQWETHSPNAQDVVSAIRLQELWRISFWDAMIITSAQRLACPLLWSEDLNDGQAFGDVLVRNPFA